MTITIVRQAVWLARIRRITSVHLRLWGVDAAAADTVVLLVSELVTNGIRHGSGPGVTLRLSRTGGLLRVEVDDGNPSPAVVTAAGPDDEHGRGMALVQALAVAWGTDETGTRTWCTLALTEEGEAA